MLMLYWAVPSITSFQKWCNRRQNRYQQIYPAPSHFLFCIFLIKWNLCSWFLDVLSFHALKTWTTRGLFVRQKCLAMLGQLHYIRPPHWPRYINTYTHLYTHFPPGLPMQWYDLHNFSLHVLWKSATARAWPSCQSYVSCVLVCSR